MVVVVVIVFNYTSPKFHKLVFSDFIDSCMHSKKIINMYLYFCISCSRTSSRIPVYVVKLKYPTSKCYFVYEEFKSFGTIEKEYGPCSIFQGMRFP
jgi:hypothetical protein